jgi:ABC-type sugar transport system permease subunit
MRLNARRKEAIAGYVFASPIILTIMIFTIYPVAMALYYSFTNYQPTEAQKFKFSVIPEEAVTFHLAVFPDEPGLDRQELIDWFDAILFVELDLGVRLNPSQKQAVTEHLMIEQIVDDFLGGKLSTPMTTERFFSIYLNAEQHQFRRYIPEFVGLNNFQEMVQDEYFWISLSNAFMFSIIVVPIQTFLALLLAVSANLKIRGRGFFKAIFFLPSISSAAAISMIFWLIYSKPGVLNRLLGTIGFEAVDWLNNPNTALGAVMVMNIWTTAGYFMITFLAGLQGIPGSLYEAASMDGARFWKIFWKITIPLLRPQILFVSIMGIIGCMQVFDQIYFLIQNMRNITISFYIYRNAFQYHRMGYASALALVLFVIILGLTLMQKRFFKEEAYF